MPRRDGEADKLGNRYEGLWTVDAVLDVLDGEFVELTVQQLGDEEITPAYNMQTNGTLLDPEWLDLLHEFNIGFGISLDGPKEINYANRVDHSGRRSYDRVRRAIELIVSDARFDNLFGGLLTVVSIEADPEEMLRVYRDMGIRSVDFLLPDGHYDNPPPRLRQKSPGPRAVSSDQRTICGEQRIGS